MRFLPLALLAFAPLAPAADSGKPIDLFDGKSLAGWHVYLKDAKSKDTFTAKDGVLECTGKPLGYIITDKEYANYKLELEWKWGTVPKGVKVPNSGVLLHVSGKDAIWPPCIEAQLMSGHAGDFWLMGGSTLAVDKTRLGKNPRHYHRMKATRPLENPLGEWNKYEIVCKGDSIFLTINGVKANEGTKAGRSKGKIALQSEGAPISFRNIKLTPLK